MCIFRNGEARAANAAHRNTFEAVLKHSKPYAVREVPAQRRANAHENVEESRDENG